MAEFNIDRISWNINNNGPPPPGGMEAPRGKLQINSLSIRRDDVIEKPKIWSKEGFVILVIGICNLFVICDL